MIKIIAAVSQNGVIGKRSKNDLPWPKDKYPEDMKWFRDATVNDTIFYGKNTFNSFGSRCLPKRKNVLITSSNDISAKDLNVCKSIKDALELCKNDENIWLIGGEGIYREGLKYADKIYLTLIPEEVLGDDLVYFPWINPSVFINENNIKLPNSELKVYRYVKVQ